jgi:proline iminopeptidase
MSARERLGLYPAIEPYRQERLKVGGGHEIYFEECGNPDGKPVLVVHGGPGGGCNSTMRRYHDPARYRIVLFDQRGCGRSAPHASLEDNTTWDLVADMERLRTHLGIARWQLFGGSWGSTLSLAYSQTHPERVSDLVLRGIFLLRREDFEEFRKVIPPEERGDMIAAYYRRLTSPDRNVQIAAARAWSVWEGSTLSLMQDPERVRLFGADTYAIAFARIECHYFINRGFFERDDQLLHGVDRIRHIPCTIVHGRYDVVTPAKNAWDLWRAWPQAELRMVADAGHAMTEPGIVHELVGATRKYATTVR